MVLGVVEHHRPGGASHHGHRGGQQAVVGTDQDRRSVANLDRHAAATGTHPGIHHRQHDSGTHVLHAAGKSESPTTQVVGGDPVGDVDHIHARGQSLENGVDHAHELVVAPVVGQERHVAMRQRLRCGFGVCR